MNHRKRIMLLDISRKLIATRLGLSYSQLNARLNDFTPWQQGEEQALKKILDEAETAHCELLERSEEKGIPYYAK